MREGAVGHSPRTALAAALLLAFGSGFGVLVLEVAGARLLAATYGLSAIPWTAIIAAVLAGLALGNSAGGWAADRDRASLFYLFLAAALWVAVPILGMRLPDRFFARAGFMGGSLATALAFFSVPAFFMGAVTPVLVKRITERVEEAGLRFGDVGAWSTGGAIAGTLAGGFVLVPAFPVPTVLAMVAASFLLFAALGAALEGRGAGRRVTVGALLLPAPFLLTLLPPDPPGLVFQGQSLHASIQVVDSEWYEGVLVRELWQNGSLSSAEILATGEPASRYQITTAWLLSDRIQEMESILVLGGAANSLPTQLKRWRPELAVTVVEIDPYVVGVARELFAYGRLEPEALEMRIEDARPFLRREQRSFDVILADVYDNLYSVPWPLVTVEAFREMERLLAPGGIVILTFSTPLEGQGARFVRRVVATMGDVFPEVRVYLTQRDRDLTYTQEALLVGARRTQDFPGIEWPTAEVSARGAPLRDDFAPVEYLQAVRFWYDPGM